MDVSYEKLKERYLALSTDELLDIYVTSDLSQIASELIDAELEKRGVTSGDVQSASETAKMLSTVREKSQRRVEKRTVGFAVSFLVLALIALAMKFLGE